jgi:hypothetical protein
VLCVGLFCSSDLFTGVCACVLYCTLSCNTFISHFCRFCMSINRTYLCDMLCLIAVCPSHYFPFPHPSPPAAIMLGAIGFDVVLQQAGM